MPFIVLYDANALYPNAQRDLLIRIAREGLVQAKWSDQILDEMVRSRARNHPDVPQEKLDRLRNLMNEAVADCLVSGYEDLVDALKLPDTGDRHVLAAAIRASAQVIVTANLKHFPHDYLAQFTIEAKSPDDFVLDQIRSASTPPPWPHACSRLPTPASVRRRPQKTSWPNSSARACSGRQPHSGAGNPLLASGLKTADLAYALAHTRLSAAERLHGQVRIGV